MKYHVSLENFKDHWISCKGELPLVASHFVDEEIRKKFLTTVDKNLYNLYSPLLERKKTNYSIEECDYSLLPFKLSLDDTTPFILEAVKNGKRMIMFYNDDDERPIQLNPKIGFIFRTSGYKSKDSGVFGLPTFSADRFDENYTTEPTLSFCGCQHTHPIRNEIINTIKENKISKFILRQNFHAKGIEPSQAEADFISNLKESLYALCIRGTGNFSFRLGEAFMMARIPVLVDTDCHFPFWNEIPYETNCIMIEPEEYKSIPERIEEFHSSHTEEELIQIQKENRNIWEKYFTPSGFVDAVDNFLMDIKCKNT